MKYFQTILAICLGIIMFVQSVLPPHDNWDIIRIVIGCVCFIVAIIEYCKVKSEN
jgi:hypothetical protein